MNWKQGGTGPGEENITRASIDITPKTRSEYTVSKNPTTSKYSLAHIFTHDPKHEIHVLGTDHKDIPTAQSAAAEHHKSVFKNPNLHNPGKQMDLFHKSLYGTDLEKAEIYPYGLQWDNLDPLAQQRFGSNLPASSAKLPSGHSYEIHDKGDQGFHLSYKDPYNSFAPKQQFGGKAFDPIEPPKTPYRNSNPNQSSYTPSIVNDDHQPNIQVQTGINGPGFPSLHAAKLVAEDHALGPHKRDFNINNYDDYPFGDYKSQTYSSKVAKEHERGMQPIMNWSLANPNRAGDLVEPEDAAMIGNPNWGNNPGHYSLKHQRGPLKGWTVRHNTNTPGTEGGQSNSVMPHPNHETPSEGSAIFSNKHEARRAAAQHAYNTLKSPKVNKSQSLPELQSINSEDPLDKPISFNDIRTALLKSTKETIEQYMSELVKLRKSAVCKSCTKSMELCKCDAGRVGNTEADGSVGAVRDMQKKEFENVTYMEALPADTNPGKAPGDSKETSATGSGGTIKSSKNLFKSLKKGGMGGAGVPAARVPSVGSPKISGMAKDEGSMGMGMPDMAMSEKSSVAKSDEPSSTIPERSVSGSGGASWSAGATRGVGLKKSLSLSNMRLKAIKGK